MNILFSCVGRRSYNVKYFRNHLGPQDRIIGTSNTPFTPAFSACDLGVLMPDIASVSYIPTVIRLCQEQDVTGLLSFFDPDVDSLSRHRDELRAIGVVPIVPSPEVSAICFDKYRTFLFLREKGWEAPETFIDLEQARMALNDSTATYPLVIKPRCGFGSQNLFYARNGRELEVFFHYAPDMLIQEKLQGTEYHLDICAGLDGKVLSVVPKRKITMRDGETDQAETSDDPALIDVGVAIGVQLGKLGLVGPLDVDLFVRDKRILILELNPRFGGGYPLAHRAGADFPRLILKMIRGEPVVPEVGRFTSGLLMMKDYDILTRQKTDFCASLLDMR
jgi:carbamoyl-phosphate synthase large subunit